MDRSDGEMFVNHWTSLFASLMIISHEPKIVSGVFNTSEEIAR